MNKVISKILYEGRLIPNNDGTNFKRVKSIKKNRGLTKTKEEYLLDNDIVIEIINNIRNRLQRFLVIKVRLDMNKGYEYMIRIPSIEGISMVKENPIHLGDVDKDDQIDVNGSRITIKLPIPEYINISLLDLFSHHIIIMNKRELGGI
jgi:hypothetical protein